MPPAHEDVWSDWLLRRRHGGNPAYAGLVEEAVQAYVARVLDAAHLTPGMRLVDIGTGEGVLAFGAIDRIGATLEAILTDISAPLLKHAAGLAAQRGVAGQCTFVECSAEKLDGIGDASVDVVVARSSIAYVADKTAAFREFHRVLKSGGRISIAEPIFQDEAFYARALRARLDAKAGARDPFLDLLHRWKSAQFPDTDAAYANNPLVNFSERDLIELARAAGFGEVHLQFHVDLAPAIIRSWDTFLQTSPHPWAPSLSEIFADRFSEEERERFEALLRPTVEGGKNITIDRMAYLNARKD